MNQKILDKNNYPRFIGIQPCGEDLLEGKPHEKIAEVISENLLNNKSKIIGIDGRWGSGKSNLVRLIEKRLENKNFHFFVYDAWGHQEDLQRRSLLEELIDDLTNNECYLKQTKWKNNLKYLLSRSREVETTAIPKISIGIILSGLSLILTPILNNLTENIRSPLVKASIISLPLLILLSFFIYYLFQEHKNNKFKNALTKLFNIYQNEQKEITTYERISEDEPSVKKFRNWMSEISKDLGKFKLVLVLDNMDRLPREKIQELWSSIHTFFTDVSYKNIYVIVPFDREHIKVAFKNDEIKDKNNCFGDDFINKTFNVIYRISPPILSDWKKYFKLRWKEAFGTEIGEENENNIIQIYDLLNNDFTPRKIIAFINEIVSIKQITSEKIPLKYIGLFILGKNEISQRPFDEIINPTYLKNLSFLYKNDEELPKYIAALFYQIDPDKALQIVFIDKLKNALNNNNVELLQKISNIPDFYFLIENAIADIHNIPNAIRSFDKLPKSKLTNNQIQYVWDFLYKLIGENKERKLEEYQEIILKNTSFKKDYLIRIINEFINHENFNAIDYYYSIYYLEDIVTDINIFDLLHVKSLSVIEFISFVGKADIDYKKYKMYCDANELDEYLSKLHYYELNNINIIPYIINDYKLPNYTARLENTIVEGKSSNTLDIITIVFKRYKELKKPLEVLLDDTSIYDYFIKSNNDQEFYFDLIAMRFSKLSNFNLSYIRKFDNALSSDNDYFIENLAKTIEYYMDYSDILINLNIFSHYPLYKAVAKKITIYSDGKSRADIVSVLKNFDNICSLGDINPVQLIERLDDWSVTSINPENINELLSLNFIKNALNTDCDLAKHCIINIMKYLNKITVNQWNDAFVNSKSYEFELSLLLIDFKYPQNAIDSIKFLLKEIAIENVAIPEKEIWNNLIKRIENQGRMLTSTFNSIRDSFCREDNMNSKLFTFFGDWLLKYSDLEKRQESLRTIFTPEVLNNNKHLELIINYKDKMYRIYKSAGKNEASDFKDFLVSLLEKNLEFKISEFAKLFGIN